VFLSVGDKDIDTTLLKTGLPTTAFHVLQSLDDRWASCRIAGTSRVIADEIRSARRILKGAVVGEHDQCAEWEQIGRIQMCANGMELR
jgi:hypothetical protein